MAEEETPNDVHRWIEEHFEKKKGTGIGPAYGGRVKMHLGDRGITKVDKAKEYIKDSMEKGTFLGNPIIHNAFQRHFDEEEKVGIEAAEAQTKAETKEVVAADAAEREAKKRTGAEKVEGKADEATRREAEESILTEKTKKREAKAARKAAKAKIKADKAARKAEKKALKAAESLDYPSGRGEGNSRGEPQEPSGGGRKTSDSEHSGFALFLMLLTMALAFVDYWFLHFGGLDYNVYLNAWKSGGLTLLVMTFVPIYTLAVLLIIQLIGVGASKKTLSFFIIMFGSLLTAKTLATSFGINIVPIIGLPVTAVALAFAMIFSSIKLIKGEIRRKFYSWVVLLFVGSAILSLGGGFSFGGVLHLIAAVLVRKFIMDETGDKIKANYWVAGLLALNFFGFGIIKAFIPIAPGSSIIANRFVFPIWFLFVAFYSFEYKKSSLIKVIVIGVFIFYILAVVDGVYGWTTIRAQMQASPEERIEAESFFKDAFTKIKAFPGKIMEEFSKGMKEATGGYYQGKVEDNQDPRNDLGVHIENLQAADKQFYQNEQVVVWGDLKAKTLDKPIKVFMSCESDEVNGTIKPDKLSSEEGYEIQRLEEIPFECRFTRNQLKAGTNNIKVKAEFNFETLGYLKAYFMDIERIRALRRENVDPLRQYGIDRKPEAVYTNGPVKLGMGTVDPPVGLSTTSDGYSYIGVTVQPQWYGRIKKIIDLTIQVPENLVLEKEGDFYCRNGFEKLTKEEEESMQRDIEGYSVYKMREYELGRIKTPIEAYKSWRCSINIPNEETPNILGNTPVAVHYYRATVDYIYEIEKSTGVYINEVPGERRVLLKCDIVCDDDDGCVCDEKDDGCGIPKGEIISKGYTCNNAPVGSNRRKDYGGITRGVDDAIEFIDAYLALNWLCARGSTNETEIDKELRAMGYQVDDETRKDIQGLAENCGYEDKKINYIESAESKIVDKIEDTVKIFKNAENNLQLTDENKRSLDDKKAGFIEKVDKVKSDFEAIKKYMKDDPFNLDIRDTEHLQSLDKAKEDLEKINY